MADLCDNRLIVIGPAETVRAFLEAAKGPTEAAWPSHSNATERSIIAAVRAGTPVDVAFRDANNRVDAMVDRMDDPFFPFGTPEEARIAPVPAAAFADWARGIENKVEAEEAGDFPSTFSLPNLVPVPDGILSESYHLVGHRWCLTNWGCKWGIRVDDEATTEATTDGDLMARFPTFCSPNSPPTAAIEKISAAYPDLIFINAWVETAHDDFGYQSTRGGEIVTAGKLELEDLGDDCFDVEKVDDEEYRFLIATEALNALAYRASVETEAELRSKQAPGM